MPEVTDELIGEVIAGSRRVFMPHSLGSYQNIPSTPLEIELALEVRRLREERIALADTIRRLRDGMETALREMGQASHYAHHDPKMTSGANCPACHARRRAMEALQQ